MEFDLEQLAVFCTSAIDRFAKEHPDEVFYAFAIDASLLCLNSDDQACLAVINERRTSSPFESNTTIDDEFDLPTNPEWG